MSRKNNKRKLSRYNPMSKEFQEEAKRLGISGNQYHQILIEEGILPRTIDIHARNRHRNILRKIKYLENFMQVINPIVPIIKKQINKSIHKNITIYITEIKENIKQFADMRNEEIYYGLKFALFLEGIVIDVENDGDISLIMRFGNENDTLPYSLNKFMNIYLDYKLKN